MTKNKRSALEKFERRMWRRLKHVRLSHPTEPLRGLAAIAAYMQTPAKTLLKWAESGRFPMRRDAVGNWYTTRQAIDRWLYRRYLAQHGPQVYESFSVRKMCHQLGIRPHA